MLPSGYIGPIAEGADGRRYVVNGPHLLSSTPNSDRFALEKTAAPIFAIVTSPDGQVWASTPWGLMRREGDGRWTEIAPVVELSSPRFVSLAIDEQATAEVRDAALLHLERLADGLGDAPEGGEDATYEAHRRRAAREIDRYLRLGEVPALRTGVIQIPLPWP